MKTGGSAFPSPGVVMSHGQQGAYEGMTLRDYFAAAAMQGLLADYQTDGKDTDFARRSYKLADAMLAEREKEAK